MKLLCGSYIAVQTGLTQWVAVSNSLIKWGEYFPSGPEGLIMDPVLCQGFWTGWITEEITFGKCTDGTWP